MSALLLRGFQVDALRALERTRHVICVAPTGSGKSRIFEEFGRQFPGSRILVVSPLVALSRQHEQVLRDNQLSAAAGGACPPSAPRGQSVFWILSPEAVALEAISLAIRRWAPHLWVIDEAHCFWDWGERFRPEFARLPKWVSERAPRSLWLTATLPAGAYQILSDRLGSDLEQVGQFALPSSLSLRCLEVERHRRFQALERWIRSRRGEAGVVFETTRIGAESLARRLGERGIGTFVYHAGHAREERVNLERAIRRCPQVVVATSAFGMGMDLPHLRWAVLLAPPPSLLALTQAVGRVARAGPGVAWVYWHPEDGRAIDWMTEGRNRGAGDLRDLRRFLSSVDGCRERWLARYFAGGRFPADGFEGVEGDRPPCGRCDGCVPLPPAPPEFPTGAAGAAAAGTRAGSSPTCVSPVSPPSRQSPSIGAPLASVCRQVLKFLVTGASG